MVVSVNRGIGLGAGIGCAPALSPLTVIVSVRTGLRRLFSPCGCNGLLGSRFGGLFGWGGGLY